MAVQVREQKNADQEGTTVYYQQQYQTQDMNQNTSDRYHGREFEKYSRPLREKVHRLRKIQTLRFKRK